MSIKNSNMTTLALVAMFMMYAQLSTSSIMTRSYVVEKTNGGTNMSSIFFLREFKARDKIACGGACVKEANCTSAEYIKKNSTCRLLRSNYSGVAVMPKYGGLMFLSISSDG